MNLFNTERLHIRPMQTNDAAGVIRYRSMPEVARYQGWEPKSVQEIEALITDMRNQPFLASAQWFQFSILLKESNELIGDCGVHSPDKNCKQTEIGITINPRFQRRGFAHEAAQALIGRVFSETDTHRVYASIDPRNAPCRKLFEKLRFRKEGLMLESLWFKGEWADDLIMAMLKREWPNQG